MTEVIRSFRDLNVYKLSSVFCHQFIEAINLLNEVKSEISESQ